MSAECKVRIELCMGSSCFARGNSSILMDVESYLEENDLADEVSLEGHLCLCNCNSGPHVKINGVEYSAASSECIIDLIKEALN